ESSGYIKSIETEKWIVLKEMNTDYKNIAQTRLTSAKQEFSDFITELTMIERSGLYLGKVLQGSYHPLQVLFPEGSMDTAESLYTKSSMSQIYNDRVCTFLNNYLSKKKNIRVLEIGAGTGGLTTHVLKSISNRCTEYMFTDVSK